MDIIAQMALDAKEGRDVCLCLVTASEGVVPRHAGSKMLVYADGSSMGSVGGGSVEKKSKDLALQALSDGKPRVFDFDFASEAYAGQQGAGKMHLYIEPQIVPMLLILGAGHVARAVASLGNKLDFRVVVYDDRPEVLEKSLFPAETILLSGEPARLLEQIRLVDKTFVVGLTRNGDFDIELLPAIIERSPVYIGLMGSRKRWARTREGLLQKGLSEESLEKVHSPIGIHIHAETPDEIAVSILAEIIGTKNADIR